MKGNPGVIEYLQLALRGELAAHNQYLIHAHWLDNRGYAGLAKHEFAESKEERKHLSRFMERMVFLEGEPDLQNLDSIRSGNSIEGILKADLKAELDAVALYTEAAKHCESVGDYVTRDIFVSTLTDEQGHVNWLETQLSLIKDLGVQVYAQRYTAELG